MSKYYTCDSFFTIESIHYGGYLQASSNFETLDILHGFHSFIHVVRGYVALSDNNSDYQHVLQPGDTLFLNPSYTYKVRNYTDSNQEDSHIGFLFIMSFSCISPYINSFNERLCFTGQEERHYLSIISTELERNFVFTENSDISKNDDCQFGSDQVIKNYLELLLISVYRKGAFSNISSRNLSKNISPRKESLCIRITDYINNHISEKITLNDIAKSVNLSVSFIGRSFKEYSGSSIIEFISKSRVDMAKKLISERKLSFTEISEKVGFDNEHYFSSRFRKYTGMTPTEYAFSIFSDHSIEKEYIIPYSDTEPDWDAVPFLELNDLHWGTESGIKTRYQIAWNTAGLHLHASVIEKHPKAIYDRPNTPIYLDSYTEFFFRPDETQPRYFNIGVNPNGAVYCGIGEYIHDRVRIVMDSDNETDYYNVRIEKTGSGWEAFWTIPVELIRIFFTDYSLEEGMRLYSNCCKCVTSSVSSHYLSWTYLPPQYRSFHRPECFGIMTLGSVSDNNSYLSD